MTQLHHEKEMQLVGLLSDKTEKEEGRSEANDKLSCDHEEQENLKKSCNNSVFFSKPNSIPSEGAYGRWFESVGGWIKLLLKTEQCRLETKKIMKAMKLEPQQFREKAVLLTPFTKRKLRLRVEKPALDLTAPKWQRQHSSPGLTLEPGLCLPYFKEDTETLERSPNKTNVMVKHLETKSCEEGTK